MSQEKERLLARKRDDLIGKELWTEFPELVGSRFETNYRLVLVEPVLDQARSELLDRLSRQRIRVDPYGARYRRLFYGQRGQRARVRVVGQQVEVALVEVVVGGGRGEQGAGVG